jgi:hypothetical protein
MRCDRLSKPEPVGFSWMSSLMLVVKKVEPAPSFATSLKKENMIKLGKWLLHFS